YLKYIKSKGWVTSLIHENKNDHGGYRNITIEVSGKNVYGTLRN
ncbi:MAG: Peptide chain release factor 1, partial [Candidatus Nomurabacteria bacterium GW2011_GWB1_37_5]